MTGLPYLKIEWILNSIVLKQLDYFHRKNRIQKLNCSEWEKKYQIFANLMHLKVILRLFKIRIFGIFKFRVFPRNPPTVRDFVLLGPVLVRASNVFSEISVEKFWNIFGSVTDGTWQRFYVVRRSRTDQFCLLVSSSIQVLPSFIWAAWMPGPD